MYHHHRKSFCSWSPYLNEFCCLQSDYFKHFVFLELFILHLYITTISSGTLTSLTSSSHGAWSTLSTCTFSKLFAIGKAPRFFAYNFPHTYPSFLCVPVVLNPSEVKKKIKIEKFLLCFIQKFSHRFVKSNSVSQLRFVVNDSILC